MDTINGHNINLLLNKLTFHQYSKLAHLSSVYYFIIIK